VVMEEYMTVYRGQDSREQRKRIEGREPGRR
jgi:hypothetical protein